MSQPGVATPILLTMLLSACAQMPTTLGPDIARAYSGPNRPEAELATVTLSPELWAPRVNERDTHGKPTVLELLPGRHTIYVTHCGSLGADRGLRVIRLHAEAGKSYHVQGSLVSKGWTANLSEVKRGARVRSLRSHCGSLDATWIAARKTKRPSVAKSNYVAKHEAR